MHTLISAALLFGALILGLALLAVLRAHQIDPVAKVAGLFLPAATPGTPGA